MRRSARDPSLRLKNGSARDDASCDFSGQNSSGPVIPFQIASLGEKVPSAGQLRGKGMLPSKGKCLLGVLRVGFSWRTNETEELVGEGYGDGGRVFCGDLYYS